MVRPFLLLLFGAMDSYTRARWSDSYTFNATATAAAAAAALLHCCCRRFFWSPQVELPLKDNGNQNVAQGIGEGLLKVLCHVIVLEFFT